MYALVTLSPPPPWIKSPLRRFTPSWTSTRVTCDCLLPFVPPPLSSAAWGFRPTPILFGAPDRRQSLELKLEDEAATGLLVGALLFQGMIHVAKIQGVMASCGPVARISVISLCQFMYISVFSVCLWLKVENKQSSAQTSPAVQP